MFASERAGLGWAGLGWGRRRAGEASTTPLGWAGLGWAGLGWDRLGWAGLGWAGLVGNAGLGRLSGWLTSRDSFLSLVLANIKNFNEGSQKFEY